LNTPRTAPWSATLCPAGLPAAPPAHLLQSCPLDFSGTATITCEATGLQAVLRFKPFRGGQVKGGVSRLVGEGEWQTLCAGPSWACFCMQQMQPLQMLQLADVLSLSPAVAAS
jgi:hypothetical protein